MPLYTFTLIDGRKATRFGDTEAAAWRRAESDYPRALSYPGAPAPAHADRCQCTGSKHADPVREGGFLICRDCAGYFG